MKTLLSDFYQFFLKEPAFLLLFILLFSSISPTIGTYLGLLYIPILCFKLRNVTILEKTIILIVLFSVNYAVFGFLNGFFEKAQGNFFFYMFYPAAMFIWGRFLIRKHGNFIFLLFFLMAIFIAVDVFIDIIQDIHKNQFINPLRRITDEFGNVVGSSATIMGIKISQALVFIGLIFTPIYNKKEKAYQIFYILLSLFALVCVVHLLNRTGLVIAAIAVIAVIALNYKHVPLFRITILLAAVFVAYFYFMSDAVTSVDKIEEAYDKRNVAGASVGTAGDRTWRWQLGLNDLIDKPLGYSTPEERLTYAHNFWLDTAAVGGDLAFFFLLIVTILHISNSFVLLRKLPPGELRSLFLVLNIGFFLTCMVEPAMEGSMQFIFLFFFFMGMSKELSTYSPERITRNIYGE